MNLKPLVDWYFGINTYVQALVIMMAIVGYVILLLAHPLLIIVVYSSCYAFAGMIKDNHERLKNLKDK